MHSKDSRTVVRRLVGYTHSNSRTLHGPREYSCRPIRRRRKKRPPLRLPACEAPTSMLVFFRKSRSSNRHPASAFSRAKQPVRMGEIRRFPGVKSRRISARDGIWLQVGRRHPFPPDGGESDGRRKLRPERRDDSNKAHPWRRGYPKLARPPDCRRGLGGPVNLFYPKGA